LQFFDETVLDGGGSFKPRYVVRSQGHNRALELDTQFPNVGHTGRWVEFAFLFLGALDCQENSPY
jgi:hypothetical protein